jgi:peroxiredoxin
MKKHLPFIAAIFLIASSFRFIPIPGYQPGDAVKDFSLKSVNGKVVSLSTYADAKGAIVIFTCNHCPFSQAYEQRIIDLHKRYASKGYPVIAINSNDPSLVPEDSFEEMVKRARKYKYPFDYLYDETQDVATAYGAARTPHVFILQKEKDDYITKYIGAIDDNTDDPSSVTKRYVDDAVNALLAGKEVPVKTTKAIGCTIKWKKAN